MNMTRKYEPRFKQEVIEFAMAHPMMPQKQIAEDFGIPKDTLHSWLSGRNRNKPGEQLTESADLRAARRRIKELEQEVIILKRAAAYFANEMRPK